MMGTEKRIRCGNHRYDTEAHYHSSITEVQACFQGRNQQQAPQPEVPKPNFATARQARDEQRAQTKEQPPAPRRYQSSGPSIWERAKGIPEGRYALPAEDDRVTFYEVEHGEAGTRWDGYVFVNRLSSDNRLPLQPAQRARAFEGILADVEAAALLYGQKAGQCPICHRTLTDDKPGGSIERGIGPDCAKKRGWG